MSLVFNVSVAFFNKYTTDVLDENTGMPQSLFRLGTDRGFFFPPLFHMLQLLHFLTFHLHLVFKYNPYHDVVTRFCVIIQPWIQSERTDIV